MTDQTGEGMHVLAELTSDIVSAYVANNALAATDLPQLITNVHAALKGLGAPIAEPAVEASKPAVPVRKSITPDFLICLDDGKRFKSLRRHLSSLGMTPEQYRDKWNLPADYPMVAPNYAATRSRLAIANGLGRKAAEPVPPPAKRRAKVSS